MSSLSEAFQAHPVHIQHENPNFTSQQKLSEPYIWTNLEDHASNGKPKVDVPVIDLNDPNALELIGQACKTWGIYQVVNHGVPTSLLDDIEWVLQNLFSLPSHQKQKAARSPNGVTGYGLGRLSSFYPKLMWYEGFTIVGSPLEHFRQLWPEDYAKYCDVIAKYNEAMKNLAAKLMWLMLDFLGITKEDLIWDYSNGQFKTTNDAFHLNCYPTCPDPDQAMGLAPHTDSTLFNILYHNNISGLQFHHEGLGWMEVPTFPGALVINVGDLLHILSNGLYQSVLHRVLVNKAHQRLSISYLYGPPHDVKIGPLEKLVGPSQPPLYRPVTWNEYLGAKAKYFHNALSSIQLHSPVNGLSNEIETGEK